MSTGSNRGYDGVPEWDQVESEHRSKLARAINRINSGKFNATGSITLQPSQTTTTLTDSRIFATSFIDFMPTTAHAATAKPSIFVTNLVKGAATINHASSTNTDQAFTYLVIG
jgi:hypothetical protein